ncbi:Diaminopimelate epimerase [Dyadobacter sp. CECT 9275]|uniref:Diaminopimelate epimerase n=1 Tax=Dyadobacter helix TaxID=2822344 RepID=A0A916J904_9BACT|nr:diaminopimelate epimerase [Dyadobacter sp. CECT 9275]CAG4993883.1 Diaminopimelate epimerase [Dyadobacter sp. CECT 9275]
MEITFYKYQGTGNDFVMIDDRSENFPVDNELIAHLCHRRFGIGADGLILLRHAEGYDFRMVYFNADGGEGSMCGNGGRCVVRFAHDLGIFSEHTSFIAVDGPHEASVDGEVISLKMSPVNKVEQYEAYDFMNTGSPHYVTYVDDIKETEVVEIGKDIRYGPKYGPVGGTNVNFIEVLRNNHLSVRTYERGVEDETYSCGTGVTACALSAHLREGWASPIVVDTVGGTLEVSFNALPGNTFDEIYLTGPAMRVYEGRVTQ